MNVLKPTKLSDIEVHGSITIYVVNVAHVFY